MVDITDEKLDEKVLDQLYKASLQFYSEKKDQNATIPVKFILKVVEECTVKLDKIPFEFLNKILAEGLR